jgi:hypothetical protein
MTVTWETVVAIAPEISASNPTEQARITTFIGFAAPRVSQVKFAESYDLAVALLSAHMLTRSPASGGGGASPAIRQKQIGQVRIEYAVPTSAVVDELNSTGYGQQFLQLRRERVTAATAVGVDLWLDV